MRFGKRPSVGAFVFVLVAALVGASASAQIPETFTNLKVIDQQTERGALVGVMRGWAGSLGVRCNHCHVGPDNLEGMDFATDEKATKRTARAMLQMVNEINQSFAGLAVVSDSGREAAQQVTCHTCHRAQAKPPLPTREILRETLNDQGAQAAVARFAELKERHDNAGRYDLRDVPLFQLGRSLLEQNRVEDAQKLLTAMLDVFPESADSHVLLGQAHLMAGDLDAATAAIAKARAIDPDNRFSNWLESQIEAARASREGADGS